jgi:large subunit ribosomal protein L31e
MAKKTEAAPAVERVYTVPLRKEYLKQTRIQRANRAVNALQKFLIRHTKAEKVRVSPMVNDFIWQRGAKKPPSKVKIKVRIEAGVATARLPEEKEVIKEEKKGRMEGLKEKAGMPTKEGAKPKEEKAKEPKPEEKPKEKAPKETPKEPEKK